MLLLRGAARCSHRVVSLAMLSVTRVSVSSSGLGFPACWPWTRLIKLTSWLRRCISSTVGLQLPLFPAFAFSSSSFPTLYPTSAVHNPVQPVDPPCFSTFILISSSSRLGITSTSSLDRVGCYRSSNSIFPSQHPSQRNARHQKYSLAFLSGSDYLGLGAATINLHPSA